MTKKTTLKHKLPCGKIETRTTSREYSHVVIMRLDLKVIREQEGRISKVDLSNFDYFTKLVAAGAGGTYKHGNGLTSSVSQEQYDRALTSIEGCATAQAYAEKRRGERLARHDAAHGDAEFSGWFVAGWCGRAALAEKLAQKERNTGWAPADVRAEAINHGE